MSAVSKQSSPVSGLMPRVLVGLMLVCSFLFASSLHAATFVVQEATETALRDAVGQANQTPGLDRIEFANQIDSIVISEGQIEVSDSLEIVGQAGAPVTLSGSGNSRILAVIDSGKSFPTLDLVHLVIEGGATTQPGTIVVNDLGQPDCSTSTGDGGSICSEFLVRLNDVIVRNSRTSGAAADGGAIWAAEGVELVFSSILNNQVFADSFGAGIFNRNGPVTCDNSNISGNVAAQPESGGGGVYSPAFVATNCVVSNNEAASGAGVYSGFVDVFASTLSGNTAQFRGGGMLATAVFQPQTESTASSLLVVNSTISGNQAEEGGGIFAVAGDQADFLIANSTITDNSAISVGGVEILDSFSIFFARAFESPDTGAARTSASGERRTAGADFLLSPRKKNPRLSNWKRIPIKEKSPPAPMAGRGPGLGVEDGRLGAEAEFGQPRGVVPFEPEVVSTIVSGNLNDSASDPDLDLTPSAQRQTNLILQNSVIGFADPEGMPVLAPLADNGCFETAGAAGDAGTGCPETHRLVAVNVAATVDQGLNVFQLAFDQRGSGFPRVIGQAIDIGAYEFRPLGIANFFISPDVLRQGETLNVVWNVLPDQQEVSCTGSGLPGTVWDNLTLDNNGNLFIDTGGLVPGDYFVALECRRDAELAFLEIPLQVLEPIEVSLALVPATVPLGEPATISWDAVPNDSATSCSAESSPPVAAWAGPLTNSGSIAVDTGQLPSGTYQLSLLCTRGDFSATAAVELAVTDEPLEISLGVVESPAIIGDDVAIEWAVSPSDEFTSCTGTGLAGTAWNSARQTSGSFLLDTTIVGPGTFDVGLECSRPGQIESATVVLVIQPLELSLTAQPTALLRGDDLTISWTGTEGAVCTGAGLPGTQWNGGGKSASGTQLINTAPLPAGGYLVGLSCERAGLTIDRDVPVSILPLELNLTLDPTSLIRGDDLTVSWTGTEGAVCVGSGLPGTQWNGGDKAASGTQLVDTEPLERGTYLVQLTCDRRGVTIQRQGELIVLPPPADLALSPAPADLGVVGSDFVEFSISNDSENPAFDLVLEVSAPTGYEIVGIFFRAPDCSIVEGDPSELRCDPATIGDWQCDTVDGTTRCVLAELPADGLTGVVIELRGSGAATVAGTIEASNADVRLVEIEIGSEAAP